MAINENIKINAGGGIGERGTSLHLWRVCKLIEPMWKSPPPKQNQNKALKIELPYDPATPYGYPNNI